MGAGRGRAGGRDGDQIGVGFDALRRGRLDLLHEGIRHDDRRHVGLHGRGKVDRRGGDIGGFFRHLRLFRLDRRHLHELDFRGIVDHGSDLGFRFGREEVIGHLFTVKDTTVEKDRGKNCDDEISAHGGCFRWSVLLTRGTDAGFDCDLGDPGLAHLIQDEHDRPESGFVVVGDQDARESTLLFFVGLQAGHHIVDGDELVVPIAGSFFGNLQGDGGIFRSYYLRPSGPATGKSVGTDWMLVQRQGEQHEGGEQEEDDVDQRDDLDTRFFLPSSEFDAVPSMGLKISKLTVYVQLR
jgi:hypothetical protein